MSASAAGAAVTGATAVVTLEPCNHHGRTGPCAQALIEAGIARVVYGQPDPNPVAAGGAATLRSAGIDVVGAVRADEAMALNWEWTVAVGRGWPFVTWKVAATLDGRVAARDGSSRWITGAPARAEVHELRSQVQAVMVGTGTALADDPRLTARGPSGEVLGIQPLRVVVGRRAVPAGARLRDGAAPFLQVPGDDLAGVLAELAAREVRHVLLEGGPRLAAAFLRAGLVDRIRWYVAPAILGSGKGAVADLGIAGISDIRRLRVVAVHQVGPDVCIDAVPDGGDGSSGNAEAASDH
jgi:diaminohydroxyphosphoribosylaminopyrimidine deaminase/5-amino-6-(5-phosphoribosylamino)uracil reductase